MYDLDYTIRTNHYTIYSKFNTRCELIPRYSRVIKQYNLINRTYELNTASLPPITILLLFAKHKYPLISHKHCLFVLQIT